MAHRPPWARAAEVRLEGAAGFLEQVALSLEPCVWWGGGEGLRAQGTGVRDLQGESREGTPPRRGESHSPPRRSKDIEASGFNGTAAFMEVRVQSIVVEFILTHVDRLFGGTALSGECPPVSLSPLPGESRRSCGSLGGRLGQSPILQMRKPSLREMLLTASWRRPGEAGTARACAGSSCSPCQQPVSCSPPGSQD